MNYYELLVELCKAKGVTLAEMCRDLGKRYNFVTKLKTGRSTGISRKTIELLSTYFDVPKSTFFDLGDNPVEQVQDELFAEKKLLFDISNKASKEQLDELIEIAKIITKK